MAKYTIELRKVCEIYGREEVEKWFSSYDINDYLTPWQQETMKKISSMWTKEKLARKIVDHYYMREIGFETPALFKHYAKVSMQEIMEEYLPLIYTKALEYDPLSSVDYDETYTRKVEGTGTNEGNSKSNSSSNSSGLGVTSDTPQGQINKQDILNGAYASNTSASENETSVQDETNQNSKQTSSTIETYTHHMEGDNGVIVTNQYLVREFRELCRGFDLEIIEKLNTLFMGLY